MSLKFINSIWVLVEVKVAPGSTSVGVRENSCDKCWVIVYLALQVALKTSAVDVIPGVQEAFRSILHA